VLSEYFLCVVSESKGAGKFERPRTARRPPPKVKSNLVEEEVKAPALPAATAAGGRVGSAGTGKDRAGSGKSDGDREGRLHACVFVFACA